MVERNLTDSKIWIQSETIPGGVLGVCFLDGNDVYTHVTNFRSTTKI